MDKTVSYKKSTIDSVQDAIFEFLNDRSIKTAEEYRLAVKLCDFADIGTELLTLNSMPEKELSELYNQGYNVHVEIKRRKEDGRYE